MKKVGVWAILLVCAVLPLRAQVTVEVVQEQDQFLPGEMMVTAVRITNRSGQTLRLGGEEDWLTFAIESREQFVISKIGEVPVLGEFTLESSKVATKRVDLAPFFSIPNPGRYEIVATVKISQWGQQVTSKRRAFDIIHGSRKWEQEFGVPNTADTNGAPEIRKYVLQQANYLKSQIRLYLRVTDSTETKTFKVLPIGPMVSFSRPEAQIDNECNLHVIYQSGPRAFTYTVFNPDGDLTTRETHDYINTRPRLRIDLADRISVTGGVRRITANDVPPPQLPDTESPSTNSAPISTNSISLTNKTPATASTKP